MLIPGRQITAMCSQFGSRDFLKADNLVLWQSSHQTFSFSLELNVTRVFSPKQRDNPTSWWPFYGGTLYTFSKSHECPQIQDEWGFPKSKSSTVVSAGHNSQFLNQLWGRESLLLLFLEKRIESFKIQGHVRLYKKIQWNRESEVDWETH